MRRRIAERVAADLRRRAQVAFEHRRRERLDVGDVVEAVADRVGRQQRGDVDVDAEQVVHRARVFSPVQALKRTMAGIRLQRRRAIETIFERGRKRGQCLLVGTLRAGGRHHAGPQLANHLLDHVGVIGGLGRVERRERELSGLAAIAVARGAVLLDELRVSVGRGRRRVTGRGTRRRGGDGSRLGDWRLGGGRGGCRRTRLIGDHGAADRENETNRNRKQKTRHSGFLCCESIWPKRPGTFVVS